MEGRVSRRLAGLLASRLPEAGFDAVPDPRRRASIRFGLPQMLSVVVTAMLAGCRSFAESERLTENMSRSARRLVGLPRRIPDTTMRDALVKLEPNTLRAALYRDVREAVRRKAVRPVGLPFGVISTDGKFTAIDDVTSSARTTSMGAFSKRRDRSSGPHLARSALCREALKEGQQPTLTRSARDLLGAPAV